MRCLHCGRMVPLGNFKTVNEARCVCGRFVLEPTKTQLVSVPHITACEFKPQKTAAKKPKPVEVEEECSS